MVLAQGPPVGVGPPGETPVTPPVPDVLTVQVDCDNGESINDVLATPAVELIIEISGTCIENVVIARDFVTLRGENLVAGLPITVLRPFSTADDPPSFGITLLIRDSVLIAVENLIIENGDEGITAFRSGAPSSDGLVIRNCMITGNTVDLSVLSASNVAVVNSTVGSAEVLASSSFVMIRGTLTGGVSARGGGQG